MIQVVQSGSQILTFYPSRGQKGTGFRIRNTVNICARSSLTTNLISTLFVANLLPTSVADPGSGTFMTPGSGILDSFFPDTGSQIPNPYF